LQYFLVGGLTIIAAFVGGLWGIPVLSWIFSVDLGNFQKELFVLIVGGGIYALVSFMVVVITVLRKQTMIAIGFSVLSLFTVFFGGYFVENYELMGASVLYLLMNVILAIWFSIVILQNLLRAKFSS